MHEVEEVALVKIEVGKWCTGQRTLKKKKKKARICNVILANVGCDAVMMARFKLSMA